MSEEERENYRTTYNEKIQLLAIANYNLGSQHEFLDEFVEALSRYEVALKFVTHPYEIVNHLAEEFKKSLKQARIRYQGSLMKGPDRTFSNLSK